MFNVISQVLPIKIQTKKKKHLNNLNNHLRLMYAIDGIAQKMPTAARGRYLFSQDFHPLSEQKSPHKHNTAARPSVTSADQQRWLSIRPACLVARLHPTSPPRNNKKKTRPPLGPQRANAPKECRCNETTRGPARNHRRRRRCVGRITFFNHFNKFYQGRMRSRSAHTISWARFSNAFGRFR